MPSLSHSSMTSDCRTRIVVTLGPAITRSGQVVDMIRSGATVFRVNLSHGTLGERRQAVELVRAAAEESGVPHVAILFDTRGPEIRTGDVEEPIRLHSGDEVWLVGEPDTELPSTVSAVAVTYPGLTRHVETGDRILIDDGNIPLEVMGVALGAVRCAALAAGTITSRRKVTLPEPPDDLPALTREDRLDLAVAVDLEVDFVAASFVRGPEDVIEVRRFLEERGGNQAIVAKIENRAAVEHIEDILEVADALMVARGDLGVELPPEDVPVLQKRLIQRALDAGIPVITATQMLESMIGHARPTRAEASDVANAIFDGSDALMLSGETAVGDYPVEAVRMMQRIAARSERALLSDDFLHTPGPVGPAAHQTVTDAISYASCTTARDLGATAIITATQSGYTARMVARHRPRQVVIAATPDVRVSRRLALVWGVHPVVVPPRTSTDGMMREALAAAMQTHHVKPGDLVVVTAGVPVGTPGTTNMLQVQTVGEILVRGTGIGAGSVTGTTRIVSDPNAVASFEPGDILVAVATDRDFVPLIETASALVVEEGGLTSHAAISGLNFGIPTVVGASGATERLEDGATITVDASHGLVYAGRATVA